MTYPIWQTQGGDLGKISTQDYFKLRLLASTIMQPEIAVISYLKGLIHADGHSRILGWSLDGYPIYGPYGYAIPGRQSLVRKLTSSYALLSNPVRTPDVSDFIKYPAGIFCQDYVYTGVGDLDIHNGRYCITPDFPNGTYAYFLTEDNTGPVYPYVIGETFYDQPATYGISNNIDGKGNAPVTYSYQRMIKQSNYDSVHSKFVIDYGQITVESNGWPYHVFGNNKSTIPVKQTINQTFAYRGGQLQGPVNKPRGSGILGYWLNGVPILSPELGQNPPLNYVQNSSYTYNLAFQAAKTQGYDFNEDRAGGYVLPSGLYGYVDSRFINAWYTGSGGDMYNAQGDVAIYLVSGDLPVGLEFVQVKNKISGLTEYYIQGIPEDFGQDVTSNFTLRAKGLDNSITDQDFSITVTGNYMPDFITNIDLGNFLDCTLVDIPVVATDLNSSDIISYTLDEVNNNSINSSGLPPGLELQPDGHIRGLIHELIVDLNLNNTATTALGWGQAPFQTQSFQNPDTNIKRIYNFTIRASDGKSSVYQRHTMTVYASKFIISSNTNLPVDITALITNIDTKRSPVMLTRDLSYAATAQSGEYYSYPFQAIDFDGDELTYSICGGNLGWDSGVNWDMDNYEAVNMTFPPGVELDSKTGYLTGKIQAQVVSRSTYYFGVRAYKTLYPEYTSECVLYKLTVLGQVSDEVTWNSPEFLGVLYSGTASRLSVEATAKNGRELYYSLKSGSRMVNGCELLPSGEIIGKPTFQHFYLDHGTTTIDGRKYEKGYLDNQTSWDRTYTITVVAEDFQANAVGEKTFTFRVLSNTYQPYDNLYLVCRPDVESRKKIINLLDNTDIFNPDDVYRKADPFYGNSNELRILTAAGIKTSLISDYIQAMQTRHRNKTLYFDEFNYAQARDQQGNHVYDVIYVKVSQDTSVAYNRAPNKGKITMSDRVVGWSNPRDSDVPGSAISVDKNKILVDQSINVDQTFYTYSHNNYFYINDQFLMTNDILTVVGIEDQSVLPEWMSTVQPNGTVPGFDLYVVLAYIKPGQGKKTLFQLHQYMDYDIKLIPFQVDRYILDNNLNINFDIPNQVWINRTQTTFDNYNNTPVPVVADYTVDYAVDLPFVVVNGATLSDIFDINGLDGQQENYIDKTIVFYTQEKFYDYASLASDGWTYSDGSVVPSYWDKLSNISAGNLRGGVWKITYDTKDQVGWDSSAVSWDQINYDKYNTALSNITLKLVFLHEVGLNQIVKVKSGDIHGSTYIRYTSDDIMSKNLSQPYYTHVDPPKFTSSTSTTFDGSNTVFVNNSDEYLAPLEKDKYLKFPFTDIFQV